MKKHFFRIFPIFLIAVIGVVLFVRVSQTQPPEVFQRTFPVMGTIACFTFYAPQEKAAPAFTAARAEFDKVIKIANLYDPESELSRLNRTAYDIPFTCSAELWDILLAAREAYRISGGAFDISAKPLMNLWGFYRKKLPGQLPSGKERLEVLKKVGLDKVLFNDAAKSVRFTVKGMSLDLGGVAKGYAVDRAADVMRKHGITSGIIDLGGNLYLGEPPAGKEAFDIGIRDARNKEKLGTTILHLKNCAVSTSGDYERFVTIDGKRYGHIMDPMTGLPVHREFSVTVTAPTAVQADCLSTSYYLRPELPQNLPDIQVCFQ